MSCGILYSIQFLPVFGGTAVRKFNRDVELKSDDYFALNNARRYDFLYQYWRDKNDQNVLDIDTGELFLPKDLEKFYAASS